MDAVRLSTLGLLALLLAGCGPRLAQMPELPQPPQRIVQYGYSFMPPDEKGWHVAGRDGNRIILGRFGPSADETVAIMAGNALTPRLNSRQDFDQFVHAQMARDAESGPAGRFTDQTTEMQMLRHAGADCERVHQTAVDHQAKRRDAAVLPPPGQRRCRHLPQLFRALLRRPPRSRVRCQGRAFAGQPRILKVLSIRLAARGRRMQSGMWERPGEDICTD